MRIEILGTPFNGLGLLKDIENPANGLRQAKLIPLLESKGHDVIDIGDLLGFQFQGFPDPECGIKDVDLWIKLSNALSKELGKMFDRESFPLLLGGDCSMLMGVFLALVKRYNEVGLVYLDAHADFQNPETSDNAEPADIILAVLTGRGPEKITHMAGKYPLLKDEDIVVYGIRAWDQIAKSNIRVYDKKRMMKIGIRDSIEKGLDDFSRRGLSLWVHFDVDVIDPQFMPVMFPESGGLTFGETRELLSFIHHEVPIVGMSIACYHPVLDIKGSAGIQLTTLIVDVLSSCA